jgi:hypothetical protein
MSVVHTDAKMPRLADKHKAQAAAASSEQPAATPKTKRTYKPRTSKK